MKKNHNITILNTIFGLVLQITTIISGFIIPRIILSNFGSETNGIISSIGQFFGYASLIEGGLTSVVMARLYKPLVTQDTDKISDIVYTTESFYHKLSIIFILYSFVLAIVYPILFKSSFSYLYIFSLVIILGLGLLIQYNFALARRTLLQADKKGYIVSITQTIILILNVILTIAVVKIYPSIHIMKLMVGMLYFIQPVVYNYFIKKYLKIHKSQNKDEKLLKSRWDGFAISIAAFIHNNTDVIVLTALSSFKEVSVYSVYALVIKGLTSIIKSISNAIYPTVGHEYAKDNNNFNKTMEMYEFVIFFVSFIAFGMAIVLINPFIQLYTNGINDANYYQPVFGTIIIVAELIACIREPYLNIAYLGNKFKEMKKPSYIEAMLNIMISILMVKKLGLIGIAIGTLIAMAFRTIYQIVFLSKNVIYKSQKHFYKKVLLFSTALLIETIICNTIIKIEKVTITNWITNAFLYGIIFLVITFTMCLIFFRENIKEITAFLKRRSIK